MKKINTSRKMGRILEDYGKTRAWRRKGIADIGDGSMSHNRDRTKSLKGKAVSDLSFVLPEAGQRLSAW